MKLVWLSWFRLEQAHRRPGGNGFILGFKVTVV